MDIKWHIVDQMLEDVTFYTDQLDRYTIYAEYEKREGIKEFYPVDSQDFQSCLRVWYRQYTKSRNTLAVKEILQYIQDEAIFFEDFEAVEPFARIAGNLKDGIEYINRYCAIFCPLGYDVYEEIGHKMQEDESLLDAAIETGLMADAVHTYIGAVLDVYENWECGYKGLFYLMDHPKLRQFVPYYDRKMAEILRQAENEDDWYALYEHAQKDVYVASFFGY